MLLDYLDKPENCSRAIPVEESGRFPDVQPSQGTTPAHSLISRCQRLRVGEKYLQEGIVQRFKN